MKAKEAYVIIASTTKLVPPAKSNTKNQHTFVEMDGSHRESPVSLSNLREKAITKKKSWYAMVINRVIAR